MTDQLLCFADLKGADIFASGQWNGLDFSNDDIDQIVKAFEFFNMSGCVPLKLGHNEEQKMTDGQPALGWVDRIWREGTKLKADFRDVPQIVHDAIRKGLYKNVSIELLRDVVAGTRTVPLVLDAVALLGADLPAVGMLSDLQALTMSASRPEGRERLIFTQAITSTVGDDNTMADDPKLVAELEQLRQLRQRLESDLSIANSKATQEAEKFARLDADTKTAKVALHRKELIGMLETAVKDKRIQASARERFLRFSKIETDDEACMRVPTSDVESYIRENPNPFVKMSAATGAGNPDEIPTGGLPDAELMARSRKLCRERGKNADNWEDLKAAGIAVMRADPALAERYRLLPDDHADGKYQS